MNEKKEIPISLRGYPDWQKKPFKMNKYELAYPLEVIERYHQIYNLPELRNYLRELVWDASTCEAPSGNDNLAFQDETEKFVEAVYWMYEQGSLGTAPKLESKRKEFLSVFHEEISTLMKELFTLLGSLLGDDDKKSPVPDTKEVLLKVKVLAWQVISAGNCLAFMMDHDKHNNEKLPTIKSAVTTADFIEKCTEPFQEFATVTGKRLQVEIAPTDQTSVTVDTRRLAFIVHNLLHAAFCFCPPSTKVQLSCATCVAALQITVSIQAPIENYAHKQEYFHAYDLFGKSAVASALLYRTKALTAEVDKSMHVYWGHQHTCFQTWVPFEEHS